MRTPRRRESLVQSGFGIADPAETGQTRRPDGVRHGLPRRILQPGQLLGRRPHRGFDLVQALRVGEHRELAVETRTPGRQTHGIACRFLQSRYRARRRHHVTRGQQRLTTSDQQFGLQCITVGQLVIELLQRVQCPVVQIGRTFVGESRHRLVRRTSAVLDCLGRVARPRTLEVVVGQFGKHFVVGARLGLERCGDSLMKPHPPHRGELGEQRLPHEGVVEPITTAGLFDDDARLARFVECVDQVLADHSLHQRQWEPAADDSCRRQCLVRLRREARKSAAHRFPDPLRQGTRVPTAAAFVHMAQRLDEEERISTRDPRQCPGQLLVVVPGFGDVGGDIVLVQATQGQASRGAVAVKVGQHRRERVRAVEVGAAVGTDNLYAGVFTEAQQMAQQQQRGLGRPVQVVEDQDDRRTRGG